MKRFWALFGTVALIAILLALPRAEAAPSVSFTALNDQLLPLSTSTIPIVRSGSVYLPSTVLSERNIGVSVSGRTSNTLALSGRQRTLTFDLSAGTASDLETTYTAQAISSNGIVYLPAYFTCQYFGLEYSYLSTDYGTVVRVKNTDANLNDAAFIKANTSLMEQYYAAYTQQTPKPSVTIRPSQAVPTSSPVNPPKPTQKPKPTNSPGPSVPEPSPEVSGTLPPEEQAKTILLGVKVTSLSNGTALLDALGPQAKQICFFFSPDDISTQGDLVRRAAGSGCQVGLWLTGEEDSWETALQKGNQALDQAAKLTTVLLSCPAAGAEQQIAFRQAGYVLFSGSKVIGGGMSAAACTAQTEEKTRSTTGTASLLFDDTAGARSALLEQIKQWNSAGVSLRRFTETSR
jgi:cell division septation protein DedD